MSFSAIEQNVRKMIREEIQPNRIHNEYHYLLKALEYLDKRMARIEKIFADTMAYIAEGMKTVSNQ